MDNSLLTSGQLNAMGTPSSAPTDALSKGQLDAMMGMSLKPDQSSAVLGHSTGLMSNLIGGAGTAFNAYAGAAKNVSAGVAKGELSTLENIGNVVAQPLNAGLNKLTGETNTVGIDPQTLKPQGTGEQAGYTGEKIGEFFAPGGAEKAAVAKGASYIDKIPDLLGLTGKAAGAITGALKTALQSAISATSFGGVTAAQTGDLQKAKGAAEFGAGAGVLGGALHTFGEGLAESLNKADFKLSPAVEAKTSKIADSAAKFVTTNRIVGSSATKYAKLNHINSQLESTLQSSLPEGIVVPKDEIIDSINTSIEQLKQTDPAIYNQAKAKATQATNILQSQEGGIISVKDTLQGKRSWAADAFKTAKKSKQDPTVSSEGAFAVEQAYQKALQGAFERSGEEITIPSQLSKYFGSQKSVSLSEFNKVYSDAINAKNLSFMAQFKNDSGLFGRLFGLWAGESIGQAISPGLGGKVIGGGVGEIMSTHLPGIVRNVSERALTKPETPEGAAKLYQANQDRP